MEQDALSVTANEMSGAFFGPTVQASSIEGGVHIHVGNLVERAEPHESPQGWTDLPDLPAEIQSLLRAQVRAAEKMPYQLRGARQSSLATVYVRQDLGSGAEDSTSEPPRPVPILDSGGQLVEPPTRPIVRVAVRPPSRTVREALDSDDHMLITGGPGQGKSTLSLRLAADVALRWSSSEANGVPLAEPVVPIRLTARELASRLDMPFPEAMAKSVGADYGALLGVALPVELLGQRVAGCRWLLLVDGLDEVANSIERDRLVTVLASWASDTGSPYRVVLTTRPIEGAALAPMQRIGAARYKLQPFDEEALRHFADNWFDDADDAYRFVRQIRAAHLDELVRVPLLATIAAIVYDQYRDRSLPDNQYELYESYLRYLRSGRPATPGRFDHVCDALLEHLGRVRLEFDTSLVAAARDWAQQHLPKLAGDWQEELTTFLAAVGPFIRRNEDLRFLHHSFAEHLAATAKARLLPECFDPEHAEFARLLHTARPAERGKHARAVLLHHTRLHPAEADRLISWLHSGGIDQHLLAARLLAWHVPAGTGVVDAFLTTVWAWAMTTQHRGREILAQVSRAAHHPGLAAWLADLMRHEDVPLPSRVEAATALSTRLHTADSSDALAVLRAIVDDTTIPVEHRLSAAEALAECGGERQAAERGLRLVLADPAATGQDCRNAAVVLSGFGGKARSCAVTALTTMLDDLWTPDDDLVEIATGLVEIGVEFHERCGEVFRTILSCRAIGANLRDAAVGLASLGPQHMADAVTALTGLIIDRRLGRWDRFRAADTLVEMGPQYRPTAAVHLLDMSAEFDIEPHDRWRLAASLAKVGSHDKALDLLRLVLTDRAANPNNQLWAAENMADLGREHQNEALQALRDIVDHPAASGSDRTAALGKIAALGEPHRTPAIAALRRILTDRSEGSASRCQAANDLIRLGPEFHPEVIEHMLEIASRHIDPDARVSAWRALRSLGTSLGGRASMALLELIGPDEATSWESHRTHWWLNPQDTDDHESMVSVQTATLRDASRSGEIRIRAARVLLRLGRRFHRTALDGLIELFRSQAVPAAEIPRIARHFVDLGDAPRAELGQALRAYWGHPHTTAATQCKVFEALELLGQVDTAIVTALCEIVDDDVVSSDEHGDAAVALARADPKKLADAAAIVLAPVDDESIYLWQRRMRELAALGADVVPELRVLLSNKTVQRRQREMCAATLAQLRPDLRGDALAELQSQAGDEFLEFTWRTDAVLRLVDLEPDALDNAIARHLAVLEDEREPVDYRCEAAYQLTQLDKSFGELAFASLRRFATKPEFTADERSEAVYWFATLGPYDATEPSQLGLAVDRDPAATAVVRSRVKYQLRGRARLEMERSLLADRAASPRVRANEISAWEHRALGDEAEAALRDVLTAVESMPAERVEAAVALAELSPVHVPEAVTLLEGLSTGRCATRDALRGLAALDLAWRRRLIADAERVVTDETCGWRRRNDAAALIWETASNPAQAVVDYTRQLACDRRVADINRVEILYLLRKVDGLDRIREIRDDERGRPATRRAAANRLRDHAVEDRAAGARVLHAIASDVSCRPALRWRAAEDLTRFGARGRELGIPVLQAMAIDDALPRTVRVDAARVLGNVRPDLRGEILRLLRGFRFVENPLVRIQVFEAIGRFDPAEGATALRDMVRDRTLKGGVRLRGASAMHRLHRDFREGAALVAKEVAYDGTVLRHIRIKATRALARWSELCRAEAQALLIHLDAEWHQTRIV